MAKLTKADIEKITAELGNPWGRACLNCDGYQIIAQVVRKARLSYGLTIFIDGWKKGEHIVNDCEERRRFLRPSEQHLYSPAKRRMLVKEYGKRLAKLAGVDKRFTYYSHDWLSARSMLRHFIANNTRVELLGLGAFSESTTQKHDETQADA